MIKFPKKDADRPETNLVKVLCPHSLCMWDTDKTDDPFLKDKVSFEKLQHE